MKVHDLNPPALIREVEDGALLHVEKAKAARARAEAGEEQTSPDRWDEADEYAVLASAPYGWSVRRIAEACDTNKDTVAIMCRMVSNYLDKATRPRFWAAFSVAMGRSSAHPSYNTGENEWYTPPAYLEAARLVLGGIDLDPASSDVAQRRVRAGRYFTKKDDGLSRPWRGRVWLNPPYASG